MIYLLANTATQIEPWLILTIGAAALAWYTRRGQTGAAVDYLEKTNRVLHGENEELKAERAEHLVRIETLEAQRDFTKALEPLRLELIAHDERMGILFERHLSILDQIAERLGRDENGALPV